MKRVILLIRVSTKYQDYTAQTNELIAFVKKDRYSDDEMVIIKNKESATKLEDKDRQGLNKMYKAIDNPNNNIEAVYCWELSRLSRIPQSLYDVRDKLIEKKIDLRTKHENFKLLNDNKEIDKNSNIMLGFYISMCENEILQKVERTRRIKKEKALEGKYTGGLILYGYHVEKEKKNDDKRYKINEEEANVIRACFEIYSTGKYGLNTLFKEIINRGYKVNIHQIQRILTSPEYKGGIRDEYIQKRKIKDKDEYKNIERYKRKYPQIISEELYNKCREIAKNNNTNIDKSKNIYYAHKLIKCTSCGAYLVAAKHTVQYQCPKKYSPLSKIECNANDRINVNAIDSLIWYLTKQKEAIFIISQSKEQIIKYQHEIDNYKLKLNSIGNRINIIKESKRKVIRKIFPKNSISENEFNSLVEKSIIEEKKEIENDKLNWQIEIKRINRLILDLENQNIKYNDILEKKLDDETRKKYIISDLENISDENIKYDLIHKHVKEIILSTKKKNYTKQIDVYFYLHEKETYYYDYRNLNEDKRLYYLSTANIENQKLPIPLRPIHSSQNMKDIKLDISKIKNDSLLKDILKSEFDIEEKYYLPFKIEKRYLRKGENNE